MALEVSQPVGTLVRVYLNQTKGQMMKRGKDKGKKVISFKGKIHEIRRDCVVLKGSFMWNGFITQFGKTFKIKDRTTYQRPQVMCKKILLTDIMRIMKIEPVTI